MGTYYCPLCKRNVAGKKTFHGVAFVILCLFVWVPGATLNLFVAMGSIGVESSAAPMVLMIWIVWMLLPIFYTVYHTFIKTPRCPICNTKLSRKTKPEQNQEQPSQRKNQNSPDTRESIHMNDLTALQTERDQLERVIEDLKRTHRLDLSEKDDEITELKSALKLKGRVQEVVHAEHTLNYFPAVVLKVLAMIDPSKRFADIYLRGLSFINYGIVCGVGFLINMYILLTLAEILPLYLANICAILVAWMWNWNFTVGPLGYLFGLSPRRRRVKKT